MSDFIRLFVIIAPSIAFGQAVELSQGVRHFQHSSNFYGIIDSAESILVSVFTVLLLEFTLQRRK